MVKNLVAGPSQLGRISIGRTNEKGLPEKCDSMRVTGNSRVQKSWIDHPVMALLNKNKEGKIHSIPVRILFDRPANNLQTAYTSFDTKGRQVCVGDGDKAKRRENGAVTEVLCPGPELCEFGQKNRCKLFSRFTVGIDVGKDEIGMYEMNPTAGFVFRSTGWNTAKQLQAQLGSFSAACGGKMAGFPADLVIRAKSSSASMKSMFFYLDLVPRGGLIKAVSETLARRRDMEEAGVTWDQVEETVEAALNASVFAEDGENGQAIVNEFFADEVDTETGEIHETSSKVDVVLTEAEVELIKVGLLKAGKSIASLNSWLGRQEDEPLATMGVDNFTKVKGALGIKPVVSDGAMAAAA